jgi:hypothetical protein
VTRALLAASGAVLALVLVAGLARATPRATDGFPHAAHDRLFPVCETCHGGFAQGDSGAVYPEPAVCARCHDDVRVARVRWSGASPRPSSLRFTHAAHPAASAALPDGPTCHTCHATTGDPRRMAVGPAEPDRCIDCHEHRADSHLAEPVLCTRCHVRVADARAIPLARIAAFPQPEWHRDIDLASQHGPRAASGEGTCAVCHARETCERCHANADRLPVVQAMPRDVRVAALEMGRAASYPVPASHDAQFWNLEHGRDARAGIGHCANCHTRPGCTGCHSGNAGIAAGAIRALPLPKAPANGVDRAQMSSTVHGGDAKREHGALAASGRLDCAQCHERAQCASCHASADSRAFHAPNFIERHAVDVFAARGECQACHSTETFCRACHVRAGVASQNMKSAFHDAQPMWVLSHGQAARLGLETCASCHRQGDCVQCHSAAGGWGVNPHGPGFSGKGAARSASSCRLCHRSAPGERAP